MKPTRLPIFLSALVYPGVGQLSQRRWIASLLFMVLFTIPLVAFFVIVFRIFAVFYGFWLNPDEMTDPPGVAGMLTALAIAFFFYAASLLDTFLAFRREAQSRALSKLNLPKVEASNDG